MLTEGAAQSKLEDPTLAYKRAAESLDCIGLGVAVHLWMQLDLRLLDFCSKRQAP